MDDEKNIDAISDFPVHPEIGKISFRIENISMPDFMAWNRMNNLLFVRTIGRDRLRLSSLKLICIILGTILVMAYVSANCNSIWFLFYRNKSIILRGDLLYILVLFVFFLGRFSRYFYSRRNTRIIRKISYEKRKKLTEQRKCNVLFGDEGMIYEEGHTIIVRMWSDIEEIRIEKEASYFFGSFGGSVFTVKNFSSVDEYNAWLDFVRSKFLPTGKRVAA